MLGCSRRPATALATTPSGPTSAAGAASGTFGYPVSNPFTLQGFRVQIFQRAILQQQPNGERRHRQRAGRGAAAVHGDQRLGVPGRRSGGDPAPAAGRRGELPRSGAPVRQGERAGHLAGPEGQLLPDVRRGRARRRGVPRRRRQRRPAARLQPGDLGPADLEADRRPDQRQLRLSAVPARDHALRRRLRLHPGAPAGRLPEVDPDAPQPAARPGSPGASAARSTVSSTRPCRAG